MSIDTEFTQRLRVVEARLRSLERVELPVAGSGGFAPSDSQYLTLAASASLTQERIFTPVAPLSGSDGGAGLAYSLSVTSAALTRVNDTNVTLTLGGAPSTALLAATSLTLGWAGQLGLARGGTNSDLSATGGAGQYLKQSSAGAAITVGTIPASDIASGAALTKVDDTNVTLALGGTPASALLAATSLTLGWTGTLAAARLNSNVVQSVVNDTNVTGSISAQALTLGWAGTLAAARLNANVVQAITNDTNVTGSISAQNLTLGWSGTLSTARGGTGASSLAGASIPTGTGTSGQMTYWTGTNTLGSAALATYAASGSIFTLTAGAATDVPLKLVGAASQSGNYLEVYDSSGNPVYITSSAGSFQAFGTSAVFNIYRYGAAGGTVFVNQLAGSVGAETYPSSGNTIGAFTARRWSSGSAPTYTMLSVAGIAAIANEAHGASAAGTRLSLTSTANGTTTIATRAIVSAAGNFGIGTVTEAGTSANKVLYLQNGTAPSSSPADMAQLYSSDYAAGDAGLYILPEITGPTLYKFVSLFETDKTDSVTNAVTVMRIQDHKSSGTAAAGFGISNVWKLQSSTTASQTAASIDVSWNTATHASRKADIIFYAWDTAAREFMRGQGNGSAAAIGFFGVTPVVRPTALTTKLTSITHTSPGTPDYAIQNLTNASGYGFVTQDEGNTVLSVILNLQTRVNELETKLQGLGLLT